jgi:hypothetical protein
MTSAATERATASEIGFIGVGALSSALLQAHQAWTDTLAQVIARLRASAP